MTNITTEMMEQYAAFEAQALNDFAVYREAEMNGWEVEGLTSKSDQMQEEFILLHGEEAWIALSTAPKPKPSGSSRRPRRY